MNQSLTLKELARKLNLDSSGLRRYIRKHCTDIKWNITRDERGQECFVFSPEEVARIIHVRTLQGYSVDIKNKIAIPKNDTGYFYIVQLVPELCPNRIKLGYTGDIAHRLMSHKTTCPNLVLIKSFLSKSYWEKTAIDYLVNKNKLKSEGGEVFHTENIESLVETATQFFDILNYKT